MTLAGPTPPPFVSIPDEPIDAVYTWVDGSDAEWLRAFEDFRGRESDAEGGAHAARFRDNGELRHSLRSLERHAPWIRQVFLVVAGATPAWLAPSHQRLTVVRHNAIFPDTDALPTFNSNAIEWQLHRIPGLSRRFIYLNDDLFLGRSVSPATWLLPTGGQVAYFENNPIVKVGASASVHDRAYAYTLKRLGRSWRWRPDANAVDAYSARRRDLLWPSLARRMLPAHVPQLYDRQILERLEQVFTKPVAATTRHRFRAPNDFVLRLAYFYTLLEASGFAGRHRATRLASPSCEYLFVRLLDGMDLEATLASPLHDLRPRFVCLNDDLGDVSPAHPILTTARALLSAEHPRPSGFEANEASHHGFA